MNPTFFSFFHQIMALTRVKTNEHHLVNNDAMVLKLVFLLIRKK